MDKNEGIIAQMKENMMSVIRDKLTELAGEYDYDLTENQYGFCTAWLENGSEVWWDKSADAIKMDELTELCALYEVIVKTENEIKNA